MKEKSYGIIPYKFTDIGVSILISKSSKNSDYGFVKGKIDKGESKKACAIRETFEEIGIKVKEKFLEDAFSQKNPKKDIKVYLVNWDNVKNKNISIATDELFSVEWYELSNLPTFVKNQRLILTDLFVKFNKIDFLLRNRHDN